MLLQKRHILMLQGPHGPFFAELATALRHAGARVWRVGINAGDEAEGRGTGYIPLTCPKADWPRELARIIACHGITDLLFYGEARGLHQTGLALARARGLTTHILEEGYLRPHWITYERQGSNAHSPAARRPIAQMPPPPDPPATVPEAHWGALRQHVIAGADYHWRLLMGAKRYPHFRSHRDQTVANEALQSLGAALSLPGAMVWRMVRQRQVMARRGPLYVLLLQLAHDTALKSAAGKWADHDHLLDHTLAQFADHAPRDAQLAVKMHPLEARRAALAGRIARFARRHGVSDRVSALPGGRLAPLLNRADAALTVCSTAGQQVLWRGLPLYAFAPTVYSHPELLPEPDLARFLARPTPPDRAAYARFAAFLQRSSQIHGSFYAAPGRADAIAGLVPKMAGPDPYGCPEIPAPILAAPVPA